MPPRDEYEMCELFRALLFMRDGEFMAFCDDEPDARITDAGTALLHKLGIVDRIFRRWYQTTWGNQSQSRHFSGTTPRQELAKKYPDLTMGNAYLAIELSLVSGQAQLMPHLYNKILLEGGGGVFIEADCAWKKMEKTQEAKVLGPIYDPSAAPFIARIHEIEAELVRYQITQLPDEPEARMLAVFWDDLAITLALNSELDLAHDQIIVMSAFVRKVLESYVLRQESGPDDFISFDELFHSLWDVYMHADSRLIDMRPVIAARKSGIDALLKKKDGSYTLKVYYILINTLDELFLFPLDRYYGAVECVWTDIQSFLRDFLITVQLLNHNLVLPQAGDIALSEVSHNTDQNVISQSAADINRLWFSSPTAFRILPRAREKLIAFIRTHNREKH